MVRGVLLGSRKDFGLRFLGFVTGLMYKLQGGFLLSFEGFVPPSLNGPQANPLLCPLFIYLFSCRMARGYEEVSNS